MTAMFMVSIEATIVSTAMPLLVGWPAGATLAARSFHRFALRQILVAGTVLVPTGTAVFVLLTPESSPITAALGSFAESHLLGDAPDFAYNSDSRSNGAAGRDPSSDRSAGRANFGGRAT
jgi:hypothetical protein